MKKIVTILSFFIFTSFAFAQKGKLAGKVTDKATGEDIIGATILIEGTTNGATTDLDGKYFLQVAPGTYNVLVSYVSYKTKRIEKVNISANEVTNLSLNLEEATQELDEVIITATFEKESQASILTERKNSVQVSDGISAEVIKKTPDRTSSDVLKRITGVSIQDNKFVIVRGLNDRYNASFINGAPLPSSESDRKAFAFDIFPANLLESINIVKTATPDMPADWAGGTVYIKTKDVPEKSFANIGINGTYNSLSTFKPYTTYQGGSTDFIGIDDGTRALPKDIPTTEEFNNVDSKTRISSYQKWGKLFDNDWGLIQKTSALPNMSMNFNAGKSWNITEKSKIGLIGAITYNKSNAFNNSLRAQYNENKDVNKEFENFDKEFKTNVLAGALLNATYVINEKHKVSLKNIFNINTDDRVILRNQYRNFEKDNNTFNQQAEYSLRWFTQNIMQTSQLGGEHYFEKANKLKFKYNVGYGSTSRDMPNLRQNGYLITPPVTDANGVIIKESSRKILISETTGETQGGNRRYIKNKENIYSANYDFTMPLPLKGVKTELKVGGYHQYRDRVFTNRNIGIRNLAPLGRFVIPDSIAALSEGQVFDTANYKIFQKYDAVNQTQGKTGFGYTDGGRRSDSYTASGTLHAAYIMLDQKVDDMRFIYGVRLESYNQKLNGFDESTTSPVDTSFTVNDFLPSVNFILSVSEKSNLRVSYSKTINRPEFRELAPFGFYDFTTRFTNTGNPKLNRAKIDNIDVRYEYFPGAGQVIAATGFFKNFDSPIEFSQKFVSSGFEASYYNASSAVAYGIELEYRQNLGNLLNMSGVKMLSNLTPFVNFSYIISSVDRKPINKSETSFFFDKPNGPLQGQSPYLFNAGLVYQDDVKNFSISAVFNQAGRRIFLIGTPVDITRWENPRAILDVNFSKTFFKKLEARLTFSDIIAQDFIVYQDVNDNGSFDLGNAYNTPYNPTNGDFFVQQYTGGDDVVWRTKMPRQVRIGLVYNF